jgi:hypothetical protein
MEDIFDGIDFEEVEVGGFQFRFPLRYFDYFVMAAAFPAPVGKVKKVLPSKKLKPVETAPGMATIALIAAEYRVIDSMDPYNEFDVVVPVTYQSRDKVSRPPGYFPLYVPVTTEQALVGGVEIFGYPKFMASVSFEESAETRRCRVQAEGKDLVALEVTKSVTGFQSYDNYTYTVKGGQLLRAHLQAEGQNSTNYVSGGGSYTLGDHPVAVKLRALEMDSTSVMHRYAPQIKALLHLPDERLPM